MPLWNYSLLFLGDTILIIMVVDLISSLLAWVASDSQQDADKQHLYGDKY